MRNKNKMPLLVFTGCCVLASGAALGSKVTEEAAAAEFETALGLTPNRAGQQAMF